MRPEEKIEKQFVEECERIGVKAYKFEIKGTKGATDRIVFLPGGVTYFFEFKVPGAEPSEHQKKFIKDRQKQDFTAMVVTNWAHPYALIKKHLHKHFIGEE